MDSILKTIPETGNTINPPYLLTFEHVVRPNKDINIEQSLLPSTSAFPTTCLATFQGSCPPATACIFSMCFGKWTAYPDAPTFHLSHSCCWSSKTTAEGVWSPKALSFETVSIPTSLSRPPIYEPCMAASRLHGLTLNEGSGVSAPPPHLHWTLPRPHT